ncbi:MAG TPA: ABC transporter ATP-binding protein [Gaiellaceae bacterium]|nr:ABC transporter ATP-binding protein [Gaiellaceae bacterium]
MPDDRSPVEARGLVKRYGEITAVDHVDLTVEPGDVYGFLGPNGAGKTTTLRIMLGLIHSDEGEVRLFGRDPQHDLPKALEGVAGFVETPHFYPYLSGRKNLELLAAFDRNGHGGRIDGLLELVQLEGRAGDRVGGYSQGMKQRLGVAASLLRHPRLLLLDEPTNGLDPGGMRDMRILITRLSGEGITVVLSSHLLAEVEELCNRVGIIRAGRIAYEGTLAELRASAGANRYRLRTTDPARARRVLSALSRVRNVRPDGEELLFEAGEDDVADVSRALVGAGLGLTALIPEQASLETFFFELTEAAERSEEAA